MKLRGFNYLYGDRCTLGYGTSPVDFETTISKNGEDDRKVLYAAIEEAEAGH